MLYYLSGLTCDDQTFITKSNGQRKAAEHGIALVVCDTSPRGLGIEGEDEDWDFGTGAGFYVNATEPKWKQYRMYDYVVKELPELLKSLSELDTHKVCFLLLFMCLGVSVVEAQYMLLNCDVHVNIACNCMAETCMGASVSLTTICHGWQALCVLMVAFTVLAHAY